MCVQTNNPEVLGMIGSKLKEFRTAAKMSQRDVAKLMNTPQPHYWRWENGKSIPDAKQMLELCKIFKCTPNNLYGIYDLNDVTLLQWY